MASGFAPAPKWALVAIFVGIVVLAIGIPLSFNRGNLTPDEIAAAQTEAEAVAPETAASEATTRKVAIVGDSYTVGEAADPGAGFAPIVAAAEQWDWAAFAQKGTGYTNPGSGADDSVYLDRVPDVVAFEPDLVIVQGSTNDGRSPNTQAAAEAVYAALRSGLPDAQIVAVGPVETPTNTNAGTAREAVRAAASTAGVQFVDAWEWLDVNDSALWALDGVHPTNAGHAELARQLEAQLAGLGLGDAVAPAVG